MKGNLTKPHCTLGGLHIAYKDIWCAINLSIRESTGGRPPSLPMGALAALGPGLGPATQPQVSLRKCNHMRFGGQP